MEIKLEQSIIDHLSARGVLAYVAVKMAEGTKATTAALAGLVRAQTAVMREGLNELSVAAPGLVGRDKNKWICGNVEIGKEVQTLDSERFRLFVDDLNTYWKFLNPKVPFAFGGKDGNAARLFLADHREWGREEWTIALKSRIISIRTYGAASSTEGFHHWIPNLAAYLAGPLNQFNRPVEAMEKHGKAIDIQQGNRAAGQAFLTSLKNRR